MAGELIDFSSNGSATPGYLGLPASGSGVALIVLQEWWGLVIKDVADRFAWRRSVEFFRAHLG